MEDSIIRRFLVDEGYLFPVTDSEIERALIELQETPIEVPKGIDDPKYFLWLKEPTQEAGAGFYC